MSSPAIGFVALLRGVNVGGKHRLPMKDLAECFTSLGCAQVRTVIQSGNVVFHASTAVRRTLAEKVERALKVRFGFSSPVVLRSAEDLEQVLRANPYLSRPANPKALHVAFLADEPNADQLASLDPQRSPPDEFTVRGRDVFLWCPNGMARTKLTTTWLDSRLETTATVRNWNTVQTLAALAAGRV